MGMSATARLKDAIKWGVPDPILFRVSPRVVRWYAKTMTWYTCGRYYEAPIDPIEIFNINPEKVNHHLASEARSDFQYSDAVSEVVNGEWDMKLESIEEKLIYKAFVQKFEYDGSWESTEFYSDMEKKINSGIIKWGCDSMVKFQERLEMLEKMYNSMVNSSYKLQSQLRDEENNKLGIRKIHQYWPPELHEVTINIGRNGRLILHDGRHRLYMAKIIGIPSIPVRIKARHKNWQLKRDDLVTSEQEENHPDLKFTRYG